MENVNKYQLPDDNPPPYNVAVGYNEAVAGEHQYSSGPIPQNQNIGQSIPAAQQFQYYHPPPPLPYAQIPQNYQIVTVLSPQPCILGPSAAPKKEIPRNLKIISYIGICVCIFVMIMAVRSRM